MAESTSSKTANSASDADRQDTPQVYWYPRGFDIDEFASANDDKTQVVIGNIVAENPVPGARDGDIYLIAHPGPSLMGALVRHGKQTEFVVADQTVNWVSLGVDHRLSDIWTTWNNAAPLSQTQIKAIADTCSRLEANAVAKLLEPLVDYTDPDGVTQAYSEYGGHESTVVTLRTARARAVAQERDEVTVQDVILGLMSSTHRDPVSLALRNLADPDALNALDAATWSTDVSPGPGRGVEHAVRDLLGSGMTNRTMGARNATILAALLRHGFDREGTLASFFGELGTLQRLATSVVAQREQLAADGHTSDLKQIDYFDEAIRPSLDDGTIAEAVLLLDPVSLDSLIPEDERTGSTTDPETLLVPATRVDVPSGEDRLGIDEEAAAFARLIAFKKTRLPLSIGIFGHWGSGKTFFLNTVKRKVAELDGEDYYQNIVTIEFNAWHYMETNIWASLVSVIFKGLLAAQRDEQKKTSTIKMLDALAAVQDGQIDAIETLINRYRAADEAQDAYVEAVDAVQSHGPGSLRIAQTIFEQVKKQRAADFEKLEAALEDEDRFRTVGEKKSRRAQLAGIERDRNVFALLDAADDMISSGRLVRSNIRKVFWSPWLLLPLTGALIAAPFGIFYLSELMGGSEFLSSDFAPVIATLTGGSGVAAIWVRRITAAVKTAFENVEDDVANHKDLDRYKSERAAEVLSAEAARQRLEKRSKEADQARESLMADTLLGRLTQLIQARAEGDTYTKHLGIIATIRADFENLSTLLAQADERASEAEKWKTVRNDALERLDQLAENAKDLIMKDRSRAARTDRLDAEAIARDRNLPDAPDLPMARSGDGIELTHYGKLTDEMISEARAKINDYTPANTIDRVVLMIDDLDRCPPNKVYDVLQAVHLFLSFPLFVAMVGVDTRWMESSLKKQLGDLVSGENGATPRDYLEKIFQIPYWSKPLQPDQAQAFVGNLLKDIDARMSPEQPKLRGAPEDDGSIPGADQPPTPDDDAPDAPPRLVEDTSPPRVETPKPLPISTFAGPTEEEADFLTEVSGYAGTTPRRVIRFLNIFLLIKTLPYGQLKIDHQRAIITQLALCVGTPEHAGAYFDELAGAPDGEQVEAFSNRLVKRIAYDGVPEDVRNRIRGLFGAYDKWTGRGAIESLRKTADVARKFTFASPEAVELETTGKGEAPNLSRRESEEPQVSTRAEES